jgi:hypothetical protein
MLVIAHLLISLLAVLAQAERDVKTGGPGKEETLRLMINGGIDMALAYDSAQLRETELWINGGVAPGNPLTEPYYYFNGPAWVSFWATLQDNVEMNLTIRTIPFRDTIHAHLPVGGQPIADRRNWGDDLNETVTVKYAYLRIKELFDPAWSLSVGQMDVIWDVRGKGNAFFLDVAHSETPWGDVIRAWASTIRTEEYPVGMKVNYQRDAFTAELGLFPVTHDPQNFFFAGGVKNQSNQQALYYVNAIYNFGDGGSRIGIIGALFHGFTPDDNVFTVGVSGVFVPCKDLEFFAEGYGQWGQAWTKNRATFVGPAFTEDGDQSAYATLVGSRLDIAGELSGFVELHFLCVSGQDMKNGTRFDNALGLASPNADRSTEFMSYENYDVMLLLNSNEWGYDFDTNIMQVTLQGGLMLSSGAPMKNNIHLILKLAYAVAPEKWEVAAAGSHGATSQDQYGFEIDFTIRWYMNKNANIYWSVGFLAGSEIIKMFSNEEDETAAVMLAGFQVSH